MVIVGARSRLAEVDGEFCLLASRAAALMIELPAFCFAPQVGEGKSACTKKVQGGQGVGRLRGGVKMSNRAAFKGGTRM